MSSNVPENAPEHCPGTQSEQAGKSAACEGCPNQQVCATAPKGPDPDLAAIAVRMSRVKRKVLVLSGKGGVGKSTVSAQLALELAARGKEVGLLDIDICGPSVPRMMGLEGEEIHQSGSGWSPVYRGDLDNLAVMSIGFMLPDPDDAVVWRGPRKNGLIKQFLRDVDWGDLDFLVVDAPPGTSDEHISIAQFLGAGAAPGTVAAVIVTTPQGIALSDVRKEINFCKKVGIPVVGVVENMSGLLHPVKGCTFELEGEGGKAGEGVQDVTAAVIEVIEAKLGPGAAARLRVATDILERASASPGADLAARMGVPFLGAIPMCVEVGKACEAGQSLGQYVSGTTTGHSGASSLVAARLVGVADGVERFWEA